MEQMFKLKQRRSASREDMKSPMSSRRTDESLPAALDRRIRRRGRGWR